MTDIAKAIVGRNECTRMPPDSATGKQSPARPLAGEINKEGNAADAKAVRPMGDAGEVTGPPPPSHAPWSRDLRGGRV